MYNINAVELTQKTTIYQVKFNDVVVYSVSTIKSAQNIIKCFIQYNVIDYVTIATTGNAIDFGDLLSANGITEACSDNHGGL